jgi:glycerate dehydrogenase
VILDPVILLRDQHVRLRSLADDVVEFSSLSPDAMLRAAHDEMDENPSPMCWTQLAAEDVTQQELLRRLDGADAVITCWTNIPDGVLLANRQLRYIGFWTNLAEHRLNLALAKKLGIHVTYVPDYGTDSVAEMTIAGMLAVSRKVTQTAKDTERGRWPYELLKTGVHVPSVDDIPQRMLRDKLLGIVGFGRIGQRVAEIALAFRMRVQYFSRHRYPDWEAKGVSYTQLPNLFSTSDIVSVHLSPYAPEKVVSAELIGRLRDKAIFVNTSAGRLVDQEALLREVESHRINVYLDVYEGLPPRQRLKNIRLQDNLFTYRAGWFTQEAITYKGESLLRNITDFLSGNPGPAVWNVTRTSEDPSEVPCIGPTNCDGAEGPA